MYLVTFIGPNRLEQKAMGQAGLDALARNLGIETFDLVRGLEPAFTVRKLSKQESDAIIMSQPVQWQENAVRS